MKRLRHEHAFTKRLAQRLHAGGLVHRRSDDREIEPVARADVAIEDIAQMEREPMVHHRLSSLAPRRIQRRQRPLHGAAGRDRTGASLCIAAGCTVERCEQSVPHEFEHLPAC